ncbi:MAG TPA: GAF domain-containing protein [Verrucomicrobiae bacterium]|nr:GAF domain-containing protein [Verrucomicrobiae bacterium]
MNPLEKILGETVEQFHSQTGTIHFLDEKNQLLHLVAQVGLPPQLLEVVKTIPVGKGIAGQVVAEGRPVSICNLQSDSSGVAKPGAKQMGVGGALCVPIHADSKIVGTLGIGTVRPYEYTAEETRQLENVAGSIGEFLKQSRDRLPRHCVATAGEGASSGESKN